MKYALRSPWRPLTGRSTRYARVTSHRANANGFTLIEMLVSLAIFALIGISAYQVLASSALVSEREQTRTENMHELDRALRIIERDLRQVVNRPVRDEFGPKYALTGSVAGELEFTRGGNDNPLGLARSDLLRVSYSLREPEPDPEKDSDETRFIQQAESEATLELLRTLSRMPDSSLETPVNEQLLLSAVTSFTIRFMDDKSSWHESWPITQSQDGGEDQGLSDGSNNSNRTSSAEKPLLPAAIEVNLLTPSTGELSRVISLR